ncbi:MAG: hypothetical protein J6R43_05705 [Paludibacteraceae bacterium]|nr:hypothetical protein [Paludibacteraceae bacterium]
MKKLSILLLIASIFMACEPKGPIDGGDTPNDTTEHATGITLLPEGALCNSFSIGDGKTITFSKGNLQYQATTATWRFAEEQYTVVGKDNEKISATYDGWIDLFGWGTSGYNEKHPYLWDAAHTFFGDGMNTISGTDYDWGNNAISNGENKPGIWRTLTADEWGYLLFDRPNATKLVGAGTVNGQNGLFILPDNEIDGIFINHTGEEVSFVSFADKGAQNDGDYWYYGISGAFAHNTFSIEEFKILESIGVVFLPSSAFRAENTFMTGMTSSIIEGYYWTGTPHDEEKAYIVYIFSNGLRSRTENFRSNGFSVRLVCEL